MSEKSNPEKDEFPLAKKTIEILDKAGIDLSVEDAYNLIKLAPTIKELFLKVTDSSNSSSQNVFEVLKEVIFVYKDELKRDDLTQEQREAIYDRMDKHVSNAREQDDSNKKFYGGVLGAVLTALVGGAVKYGPKIIKAVTKK